MVRFLPIKHVKIYVEHARSIESDSTGGEVSEHCSSKQVSEKANETIWIQHREMMDIGLKWVSFSDWLVANGWLASWFDCEYAGFSHTHIHVLILLMLFNHHTTIIISTKRENRWKR